MVPWGPHGANTGIGPAICQVAADTPARPHFTMASHHWQSKATNKSSGVEDMVLLSKISDVRTAVPLSLHVRHGIAACSCAHGWVWA